MKTKILLAVLLVFGIIGGLAGAKALQIRKMIAAGKSATQPPETVSTVAALQEKWPLLLTAIGSVTAVQGVTISPELAGQVREIGFASGALVQKDDVLVRLDISSEEAQLRALEAQAELARVNIVRMRKLHADQTVSQADLDTAEATLKQAQANADAIRTTIEKKIIRAPFAGRLGLRQVNLGQYLDPGKPIVTLQSLSPVYAEFVLPQQELARLKTGLPVNLATDAYPERAPFRGTLTALTPELDPSTRSVGLQATFPNDDQLLRPGMFARLEVVLPEEREVLAVPTSAVLSAPYGDSVFVVESKPQADGKPGLAVRQQFIRVGEARGDFVNVESGLKAGERVVSAGVFKLRNGMTVVENNRLAPKPEVAPHPADS